MTSEDHAAEVVRIIAAREGLSVEFKETFAWDVKNAQKNPALMNEVLIAITAMLNRIGGEVLIGVTDTGEVCGIEPDLKIFGSTDRLIQAIESKLEQIDPKPVTLVSLGEVHVKGQSILRITVRADRAHQYLFDGELYVRRTSGSRPKLSLRQAMDWWTSRKLGLDDESLWLTQGSQIPAFKRISPYNLPYECMSSAAAREMEEARAEGYELVGANQERTNELISKGYFYFLWLRPDGQYVRTCSSLGRDGQPDNIWMLRPIGIK